MRTIVIIGGIILAGAAVIAVVQNDKKKDETPVVHQEGDGHDHSQAPVADGQAPMLNPAHGLAGHRCDLPVGAPLTTASGASAPAQSAPVINMNQPAGQIQQQPIKSAAPAGVKLNPAHGMPGHRCDLQVGAPLS